MSGAQELPLGVLQTVLARLLTDAALCERFLADPQAAAAELGLKPEEGAALEGLSASQLAFFARSLVAKRRGEVEKLLPLSCRVMGAAFAAAFARFARVSTPSGEKRHRADALAFAAWLPTNPEAFVGQPDWLPDLVRFEAAWLETSLPVRRCLLRRFRYPIRHLVLALTNNEEPGFIKPGSCLLLWFRLTPRSRWRALYFRSRIS